MGLHHTIEASSLDAQKNALALARHIHEAITWLVQFSEAISAHPNK
jgi:hypothetical protein